MIVDLDDLPVRFPAYGYTCIVDVRSSERGRSHFVGYVDLPDDLDGPDVAPLLEAPGGLTYVGQDRLGFDTDHAYMLNVDDDGQPFHGGGNQIEAEHEREETTRYDAQAALDATVDLARALARGANMAGEVGR